MANVSGAVSPPVPAELAARLRVAMARTVRRFRREPGAEHSPSVISALATLNRRGPLTLSELAEAEGISRPSATVLGAALARRGLIERDPDRQDRRLVRVNLTAEGQQALSRSRTRRNAFLARRLRALSQEELGILDRAATILERLLEEGS